jgi:hypothetical protein
MCGLTQSNRAMVPSSTISWDVSNIAWLWWAIADPPKAKSLNSRALLRLRRNFVENVGQLCRPRQMRCVIGIELEDTGTSVFLAHAAL